MVTKVSIFFENVAAKVTKAMQLCLFFVRHLRKL